MIATDKLQPVSSPLADLREMPLAEMAALSAGTVDAALRRILPGVPVATPEPMPNCVDVFTAMETTAGPTRLAVAATLLVAVVAVATAGYAMLEGWSLFDAFYMTITTITTVGGGEPRPMDLAGKWWTIAVVIFGFGSLTYTVL